MVQNNLNTPSVSVQEWYYLQYQWFLGNLNTPSVSVQEAALEEVAKTYGDLNTPSVSVQDDTDPNDDSNSTEFKYTKCVGSSFSETF